MTVNILIWYSAPSLARSGLRKDGGVRKVTNGTGLDKRSQRYHFFLRVIGAGVTAGPNVRQNFYKNTHIFFGQAGESRNYITRCGCFRAINKQYNNNYGRIHGVFLWVRACVSVSHKCQTPRPLQHPVTQYSRSKMRLFYSLYSEGSGASLSCSTTGSVFLSIYSQSVL